MADERPPQSYATHTRYDPIYHFFVLPVLSINLLVALYFVARHPWVLNIWNAIVAAALLGVGGLVRIYGLRNQDRIIRLEERVRMMSLLPDDLRSRINELHMNDLIALRFCSDEELADAVRAVLNGEVQGKDAIKQGVKNWRPDYHRL